ncbi:MAG: beta-glucanase precursor [Gammaproteobacteria bacterium]
MKNVLALLTVALFIAGCSSTPAPKAPAVLDFGDYTSQTLTTNAWLALGEGNYAHAIEYSEKCSQLYETQAKQMQASLKSKAHMDRVHEYWALNDVGTSYFIKGEALAKMGKTPEAIAAFTKVRDELSFAQTWDPKGWFWSPADAAYAKIAILSEDF